MKAAFYSPYLESLGGGERYVLTLIAALNQQGWDTVLFWDGQPITDQVKNKFHLDISKTQYLPNVFQRGSLIKRIQYLREYDLIFFVSDGSLPFLFGKRNIVHLQVPFKGINGDSLINQIKNKTVTNFVVNSEFTKNVVDQEYGLNSQVIYPPVEINEIKPGIKQNSILFAARFSNLLQQKCHHVLIHAFKRLYDTGVHDYQLWLAGSTEVGSDGGLLEQLKTMAAGYPIKFYTDIDWQALRQLYIEAKFFWSAVGYEADEENEPEKCEHFGISLVEAMAAGCVPIVINKGGYREIIINERSGYLWNDFEQLLNITTNLFNDQKQVAKISQGAQKRAQDFSKDRFVN